MIPRLSGDCEGHERIRWNDSIHVSLDFVFMKGFAKGHETTTSNVKMGAVDWIRGRRIGLVASTRCRLGFEKRRQWHRRP